MVGVFPYYNLIIHATVSITISFIITATKFHVWILEGLHTYILPENLGDSNGQENVRAAIRRPEPDKGSGLEGFKNISHGDNHDSHNTNHSSGLDQSQTGFDVKFTDKSKISKKRRDRAKEKFEFDESNAQIFRLRLVDDHLQTRLYFAEYRHSVLYSVLALSNLLVHQFLPSEVSQNHGISRFFADGTVVPIVSGGFAVLKLSTFLVKLSFERSASKRSEKQLSIIFGFLGFLLALLIILVFSPNVVEFKLDSVEEREGESRENFTNGFMKSLLAVFAGCISGFLYIPASKNAHSFWLGTDQLHWNLSVISCGKLARMFLYANFLITIFTSLLWINPMIEILVKNDSITVCEKKSNVASLPDRNGLGGYSEFYDSREFTVSSSHMEYFDDDETVLFPRNEAVEDHGSCIDLKGIKAEPKYNENWVHEVGMLLPLTFARLKLQCLLILAILQLLMLRPNLQMYLNEAVLSWYQRLHASRVPDLDFSRAKIFLHNYYLCQVVLQFFIPPTLVLLFLGLSQIQGSNSSGAFSFIDGFLHSSSFLKEGTLFMAWWIAFVWAIFTSFNLALFRFGYLFIS